jgi:cobalt transporter subunit CbtB
MLQVRTETRRIIAAPARVGIAMMAALFGLLIVYSVGLAQPGSLHNAAHDSRHSLAFPCH